MPTLSQVPISTVHLFPQLDRLLIKLLRSLTPEEWAEPTIARLWKVKDIAAHLLDGNIRMLSMSRDGFFGEQPDAINSYQDLVNYLNQLNADWVKATRRMSPPVLVELLELTGQQCSEYLTTLDLMAPALFSVAWAGEQQSANWFHVAREYTEKWHHQQQIREAVGKPGLMTRELFYPFIDTFMRGLPHAYRDTTAAPGTTIKVTITTDIGGDWYLVRTDDQWQLRNEATTTPEAEVDIAPEIAWKLFTKGLSPDKARAQIDIKGDEALGETVLSMVAVMA
ncbi:maleylpyruvate isomerase family mycothiol-dependent enzyme [Telluribacter humicola]|uniref:maleylpyruvate isomerase family mycothiol-dependent enzyme n=1 Tax=Telluribacter humicola TaxID=1720261 RepID=UPI001A966C85|nr:maleylpyruvate isomerase family mycothiol-dependent enzyme [Telluribacter humicola]